MRLLVGITLSVVLGLQACSAPAIEEPISYEDPTAEELHHLLYVMTRNLNRGDTERVLAEWGSVEGRLERVERDPTRSGLVEAIRARAEDAQAIAESGGDLPQVRPIILIRGKRATDTFECRDCPKCRQLRRAH